MPGVLGFDSLEFEFSESPLAANVAAGSVAAYRSRRTAASREVSYIEVIITQEARKGWTGSRF